MVQSKVIGQKGEDLAADFLAQKGYRIVERNFRSRFGEIDLIVKKKKTLVFVEVKARKDFAPEWAINRHKLARVQKMAEVYLIKKNPGYQNLRIDVVCILFKEEPKITHYQAVQI
ncbi:YraN family protein [Patescibacteria group bacterium]